MGAILSYRGAGWGSVQPRFEPSSLELYIWRLVFLGLTVRHDGTSTRFVDGLLLTIVA